MSNSLMVVQSLLPPQPSAMGFFAPGYEKLEDRDERKKDVKQAVEEVALTPPEKEVKGQREEDKKDEDLECELHLIPMDVDKVLVNGIELELTKDSEGGVFISRHFRQWL